MNNRAVVYRLMLSNVFLLLLLPHTLSAAFSHSWARESKISRSFSLLKLVLVRRKGFRLSVLHYCNDHHHTHTPPRKEKQRFFFLLWNVYEIFSSAAESVYKIKEFYPKWPFELLCIRKYFDGKRFFSSFSFFSYIQSLIYRKFFFRFVPLFPLLW